MSEHVCEANVFGDALVSQEEVDKLKRAQAYMVPALRYAHSLSNPNIPVPDRVVMQNVVTLMIKLIDLQHKGVTEHPKLDWIKTVGSCRWPLQATSFTPIHTHPRSVPSSVSHASHFTMAG